MGDRRCPSHMLSHISLDFVASIVPNSAQQTTLNLAGNHHVSQRQQSENCFFRRFWGHGWLLARMFAALQTPHFPMMTGSVTLSHPSVTLENSYFGMDVPNQRERE
ncbi:hypothetical protein Mapa_016259 [Marchantia paleacea]|nr:hypothetical protein Mapa_016259 [Marchantia paleacea]